MIEVASQPATRRLGRGLSALLGGGAPSHEETDRAVTSDLREIPTGQIVRNPFQPRQHFDPEALGELASSIKEHGILQPLIVRAIDNGFQLIAGERRWQAAQRAGLPTVPCRVVDVIDKTACEFALEENLKRKDLNDLEKAQAFREYLTHFECTIEELGKQLSMSRSAVSNILRLLELPDPVKNALHGGKISAGHARALLSLPQGDQLELSSRIQAEQLSVRATEAAVREILNKQHSTPEVAETPAASPSTEGSTSCEQASPPELSQVSCDPPAADACQMTGTQEPETIPIGEADAARTNHVQSLEEQLRNLLGVPVEIKLKSKESGQIVVPFANNAEFERILRTLRQHAA
ncbi:ParB/RepB/Spo0J family partition protein [Planctomicrobium sp. SH664]|uniref:ParB/RepB/Spo0J family partition protein n=1 Tax=Planctomicrobium sp. SH664 TaxID=3448125 RepID=UPI003F5C6660